ncbi:MAG: hypothetical protein AVDCRST_MAG68-2020, partial [uncultured Gemmatimonadetes bacterium]
VAPGDPGVHPGGADGAFPGRPRGGPGGLGRVPGERGGGAAAAGRGAGG